MNSPLLDLTPHPTNAAGLTTMWLHHDGYLFQTTDTPPYPGFYPLYRHGELYSFSILPLILAKGTLRLNSDFVARYLEAGTDVAGPNPTIDQDIERIGGPSTLEQSISDRDTFVRQMVKAMNADIRVVCEHNPDKAHFVLCGGKDSLNILLADWPVPVIALSAEPNYPLVCRFVEENGLNVEVRRLEDLNPSARLTREIAEASCLAELSHWKWTEHLRQIAVECDHQAVFWKGQQADATLTDYWRSYTSSASKTYQFARKVYQKIAQKFPGTADALFAAHAIRDLEQSLWMRSGVGQGAHLGVLRSICNTLFVSAYHGPATTDVMRRIDLRALAHHDIRPFVGHTLLGRDVQYPVENPAPPASNFRHGKRTLKQYLVALEAFGVTIEHSR